MKEFDAAGSLSTIAFVAPAPREPSAAVSWNPNPDLPAWEEPEAARRASGALALERRLLSYRFPL